MFFRKYSGAILGCEEGERNWWRDLLRGAFPEARSENELAQMVADHLSSSRRPVHPRTVRNWLRGENSPHYRYVLPVIAMVGAEKVFEAIDPERAA